jgi:hypothetical protein
MKSYLIAALLGILTLGTASAAPQERWILVGDSIQAQVFGSGGLSKDLTANRIPQLLDIHIQNLSSPGASMSGVLGFYNSRSILGQIDGYFGAKGVIITVGTNDWGRTSTSKLFADYKAYVVYAKSLGLEVVCVTPIWRSDELSYKPVPGTTESWQLAAYRWTIEQACIQGGGNVIDGSLSPSTTLPLYYGDPTAPYVHLNKDGHSVFTSWLIQRMNHLGFWL